MNIIRFFLLLAAFLAVSVAQTKTPNPYKILGISQTATEEEIKKAFKKRSIKYHPDRNTGDPNASDKYAKVINAYELLKDPQRRKMYDMTGSDNPQAAGAQQGWGGFQQGGGFPGGGFGINIEDLLRMGGMGGMGGARGQQRGGQKQYTFSFGGGDGGFRF